LILASSYKWNVSWLAVDDPYTTKNVNGIRTVSPHQVTPSWLRGYGVSLLLSDSRLPTRGQQLWNEDLPLRVTVGCHPPRQLGKPSKEWTSSILPWNHAMCGGLSALFGKHHLVTHTIEDWDASWSSPWLPRHQLTSILSAKMGGRTYKAPHKASWPPADESLT
jgi:hypothetical protein